MRTKLAVTSALTAALVLSGAPAVTASPARTAAPAVAAVLAPPRVAATAPRRVVRLTFDDGPSPTYTPKVLETLRRYGVRATFFVTGQQAHRYPYLVRAIVRGGHSVQNHTYSHPSLPGLSWPTFRSQILRTDAVIRAAVGRTPTCVRPPYGATNPTVRARLWALGKRQMLWTVDPRDWSRPGTSVIVRRVLENVRPGSVVLMHDAGGNRSQTVAALPSILEHLKARGYTFWRLCH